MCKPQDVPLFCHCMLCYLALPDPEARRPPGKQERTESLGALNDAQ